MNKIKYAEYLCIDDLLKLGFNEEQIINDLGQVYYVYAFPGFNYLHIRQMIQTDSGNILLPYIKIYNKLNAIYDDIKNTYLDRRYYTGACKNVKELKFLFKRIYGENVTKEFFKEMKKSL